VNASIRKILVLIILLMGIATPAAACRLALALTIDVSGSIDPAEYRFQMDGLADALEDPDIRDALVLAQAAVMVVQWSGVQDQEVSVPWRRMLSIGAVSALAAEVRGVKRRWHGGKTAVGEALQITVAEFDKVADCTRRVIDVSGDGMTNAGSDTRVGRAAARQAGVTVNGVAIDRLGMAVTSFYRNNVVTGPNHFVETSRGYSDYPETIRRKLYREVVVPAS